MTTLPMNFRQALRARELAVGLPEIENKFVSSDGTVRYLLRFADGQSVETVWMPEGDGGEAGDGSEAGEEEIAQPAGRNWRRATICVSSQVGCAVDCQFCLTALLGLKRNLTAGEIVGQVCAVLNDVSKDGERITPPEDRINLVFMGMGEPLLNYDNFMTAVRLLVEGCGIPESGMTVSTAGVVPRIKDLGAEPVRPKLAISLNASNDETRARIMPIDRKWNLAMLIEAAREFPLRKREQLTFEYVLLGGVNDAPENAREVLDLVRGIRAKVNLIAWNPGPGVAFVMPDTERVLAFRNILIAGGVPAFIRKPRGRDIYAACGQLKRTVSAS
jgi:23S rRNA (adenine2503-C2)-methyltransferase